MARSSLHPTWRRRVLVGPLALSIAAVWWWWQDRPVVAATMAGAAVVLLQVLLLSEGAARFAERSVRVTARWVGIVLGVALLAPLYLLVMTPLAAVPRLLGTEYLPVARRGDGGSGWVRRRPSTRDLTRAPYLDERSWERPPVAGGPRWMVVRVAIALLLVQGTVYVGYRVVQSRRTPEVTITGAATVNPGESAALAGDEWGPEAQRETAEVSAGLVYSPVTGSTLRDHAGTYVNVRDLARRSYVSPLSATREPLDVWFFGGSTMFGFDLQRDEHTIPSEFVRLAERDGFAVRATNFGSPGYVNYQETMLLQLLVTGGRRPDLVVFYDGINDRTLQLINALSGLNPRGEPGALGANRIRTALVDGGVIVGGNDDPPPAMKTRPAATPPTAASVADDTISAYQQGIDVSRMLAERYGFPVVHFWQPDIFSRTPLDPGESALLPDLALDRGRFAGMAKLARVVRERLPSGVVDISDALDHVDGPVLSDYVHLNERGGRAVAEAMYATLAPEVRRLSEG